MLKWLIKSEFISEPIEPFQYILNSIIWVTLNGDFVEVFTWETLKCEGRISKYMSTLDFGMYHLCNQQSIDVDEDSG